MQRWILCSHFCAPQKMRKCNTWNVSMCHGQHSRSTDQLTHSAKTVVETIALQFNVTNAALFSLLVSTIVVIDIKSFAPRIFFNFYSTLYTWRYYCFHYCTIITFVFYFHILHDKVLSLFVYVLLIYSNKRREFVQKEEHFGSLRANMA